MDRIFAKYKYKLQKIIHSFSGPSLCFSLSCFFYVYVSLSISLYVALSLSMSIYVSHSLSLSLSVSFYPSLCLSLSLSMSLYSSFHTSSLFSASIYHEVRLEGHSHSFAHYARYSDIGVAQTSAESTGDIGGWAWEGRRDPKSYYLCSHSFHLSTI